MLNKELYDSIKELDSNQVEEKFVEFSTELEEGSSLDYFKTLVKAAKNAINFEEWSSIVKGIEENTASMKMSMQELESLRGGAAGSNFGWNQIFGASLAQRDKLMKAAIKKQKRFEKKKNRELKASPRALKKR